MVPERVSVDDAYRAMFEFLEGYLERTRADEIGALLGCMNLAGDGQPMDPAIWDDWMEAVRKVTS